jgi:hypothetical protein
MSPQDPATRLDNQGDRATARNPALGSPSHNASPIASGGTGWPATASAAKAVATMRRRAAPVRWRQYLCRAESAHNTIEAASIAAANDRRLDRPELVAEGGDGALPLRLRWPKRDQDCVTGRPRVS